MLTNNPRKFDFVPLSKILKDLSKERTVEISDDEMITEPTITTKTHMMSISDVRKGKDVRIKKRVRILPGDLVFSRLHTQNGAFAFADREYLTTNTFVPFEIDAKTDKQYLYWALHHYVPTMSNFDTAGRETYKTADILNLEIPMPSWYVQNGYGKILDLADELKNKSTTISYLEKQLIQSIYFAMFGDSLTNLHNLPIKQINQLLKDEKFAIRSGPFGSQLLKNELLTEGIRVLYPENIVNGKIVSDNPKFITEEKYQQLKGFSVKSGDIVISLMGTIGKVAVVPDNLKKCIISKHLLKITLDTDQCLPEFLKYTLQQSDIVSQINSKAGDGAIMKGLNTPIVREIEFHLPLIEEQEKFLILVELVEKYLSKTKDIRDKIEDLPDSLVSSLIS